MSAASKVRSCRCPLRLPTVAEWSSKPVGFSIQNRRPGNSCRIGADSIYGRGCGQRGLGKLFIDSSVGHCCWSSPSRVNSQAHYCPLSLANISLPLVLYFLFSLSIPLGQLGCRHATGTFSDQQRYRVTSRKSWNRPIERQESIVTFTKAQSLPI